MAASPRRTHASPTVPAPSSILALLGLLTSLSFTLLPLYPPPAEAREPSPPQERERAPGELRELGAAAWIPEDASWFSSTLRLGEQIRALTESAAWKRITVLPLVQMLRMQVVQSPLWSALQEARRSDPDLRDGLAVLEDALSQEIFLWADAPLSDFIETVGGLYLQVMLLGIEQAATQGPSRAKSPVPALPGLVIEGTPPAGPAEMGPARILPLVLDAEARLQIPPLVLGFRLQRPKAAEDLLERLASGYGGLLPAPLEKEAIAGGRYWHLRLSGERLPAGAVSDLIRDLTGPGVSPETTHRLRRFIRTRRLALSVGLRGDYLVLSLSSDTKHLGKPGSARALAESPALAPVRSRLGPGVCSLSYTDARLAGGGKVSPKDALAMLDRVLGALPEGSIPEGLAPRLRHDAAALVDDLNRILPDARPAVSVGFLRGGIETVAFSAWDPTAYDAGRPLGILERGGASPLVLLASRSPPAARAYARVAHWVRTGYGYFRDFAVPRMSDEDRAEYERFRRLFVGAIEELHAVTAELLLPAIDNTEILLLADGGGSLALVPGRAPLAFPRPAVVLEIRDREKLTRASARYRTALDGFLARLAAEYGSKRIEVPALERRDHPAGNLYVLPLGVELPPGIDAPRVLVTDRLVVIGISQPQIEEILAEARKVESPVVDIAAPAGAVFRIELARLSRLLIDDARTIVGLAYESGDLPPDVAQLAALHLPELAAILGTLKSYTSRTYRQGDLRVTHSFLRIEDIAE